MVAPVVALARTLAGAPPTHAINQTINARLLRPLDFIVAVRGWSTEPSAGFPPLGLLFCGRLQKRR